MTTGKCPVCYMRYALKNGVLRNHGTNGYRWCKGSGMEPYVPPVAWGLRR